MDSTNILLREDSTPATRSASTLAGIDPELHRQTARRLGAVALVFGLGVLGGHAAFNLAAGTTTGTPAFLAPEMARTGAGDGRSDLYSLGAARPPSAEALITRLDASLGSLPPWTRERAATWWRTLAPERATGSLS